MISSTSSDPYLQWLLDKVNAESSYKSLCTQLYQNEFKWFIPNDDNRVEDGRQLRLDFLDEFGVYSGNGWSKFDCSILELIIGLSKRLSYDSDTEAVIWFWEMLDNLNLLQYPDGYYDESAYKDINKIIRKFNNRTYKENGDGGIFPLKRHNEDQRRVELWYQMSAYLLENSLLE